MTSSVSTSKVGSSKAAVATARTQIEKIGKEDPRHPKAVTSKGSASQSSKSPTSRKKPIRERKKGLAALPGKKVPTPDFEKSPKRTSFLTTKGERWDLK